MTTGFRSLENSPRAIPFFKGRSTHAITTSHPVGMFADRV